jgi:hypothetical protein
MNKNLIIIIVFAMIAYGCEKATEDITYKSHPNFLSEKRIEENNEKLSPIAIQKVRDTLYVIYNNKPRIDLYNPSLDLIRSIHLINPEEVYPTKFQVFDSSIIVSEHFSGRFVLFNIDGEYIVSFDKHSDEETPLSPFAITYYGGVAYIGDLHLKRILAVSMVNADNVTEIGELILKIPSDTNLTVDFASEILVTMDGRLIAGDAIAGEIKVFTCDGQYIYNFDNISNVTDMVPMGFAYDNFQDPDLIALDTSSFDPSGVRTHGRLHVVDAQNNKIHMFNPYGKYISSYPDDNIFGKPTDIAIDRANQIIYVTDSEAGKIVKFQYRVLDVD